MSHNRKKTTLKYLEITFEARKIYAGLTCLWVACLGDCYGDEI